MLSLSKLKKTVETVFERRTDMGYNGKEHLEWVQSIIDHGKKNHDDFEENKISDGYHTFEELYEFRLVLQALLFNEWAKQGVYDVHKSWRHHDGEKCFSESKHTWFIVVAITPDGQVTNHYKAKDWKKFKVPAVIKAKYEFDGHTPQDVLSRLKNML
tara:strand:- start:74342 stop:74812 length:471 start_codon:yes stop_codon:yes gene_type:complete